MLETKTAAELLYYALTTLRGSRTLGEEYCDIVHVEANTLQLPLLDVGQPIWNRGLHADVEIETARIHPYFRLRTLPPSKGVAVVPTEAKNEIRSTIGAGQNDRKGQHAQV
jgi:hypothetical protein